MGRRKSIPRTNDIEELGMPALTQEAQENRCISLSYDLVERRLRDGSASSQETTFFLKLGSEKEKMEVEKARLELDLIQAKTEQLKAEKASTELFTEAIQAFKTYSGNNDEDEEEDGYDY